MSFDVLVVFGAFFSAVCLTENIDLKLPSACNELSDGYHYIQPLSKSILSIIDNDNDNDNIIAPPIKVKCSNGYTIINPKLDPNIKYYFSSFHDYHETFSGPSLDEHTAWDEWWLPAKVDTLYNSVSDSEISSNDDFRRLIVEELSYPEEEKEEDIDDPWISEVKDTITKWSVSEDCNTCIDSDTLDYGSATTYYMTGDTYGCNWYTKFICDFDVETLECFECSSKTSLTSRMYSGKCGHMVLPSYISAHTNHKYCTEGNGEYLPSIGTISKYCVCYKPSSWEYFESDVNDNTKLIDSDTIISDSNLIIDDDTKRVIYLNQNDFLSGTYRITRPGTYVLESDIIFDFNSGDTSSPNSGHKWMPQNSQSDIYPGAGEDEWDGPYWLGFFAGITIESSDVTLDLAGHKISMSHAFYLQQRIFTCIELNNKMFRDGEGPTLMGSGLIQISNIIIQNGIIGLTSHLGIHGNSVTSITLKDLSILDFETHGIAINEFYALSILDTNIGPSVNGQLGLNGLYTVARHALPIFRDAARNNPDSTVSLSGHMPSTLTNLVHILVNQMDLAFNYAYNGIEITDINDENYDDFLNAKQLFINEWGVPRAGVIYGALLRSRGASVFGFGKNDGGRSKMLTMTNVIIHDLTLSMDEVISIGNNRHRWIKDMFNGPVPFKYATDNFLSDLGNSKYIGNAWTDLILGMRLIDDSWWHLGRLTLWNEFLTWARDGDITLSEALGGDYNDAIFNHCNNDYLGHVPKGALALRLENIDDVDIDNLEIYNIFSASPLGSDECGPYTGGDDGGMPLQNAGTNPGYGGTNSRAIYMYDVLGTKFNNLYVHDIISSNGPSYGLYLYETPDVILTGNTKFENIHAGLELLYNNLDYSIDQWPNMAARSCAIEMEMKASINKDDSDLFTSQCMIGHAYCQCTSDQLIQDEDNNQRRLLGYDDNNNIRPMCRGVVNKCNIEESSYQFPFHNIFVTKDGSVSLEDRLDGGFQAISYQEYDLNRKIDLKYNNSNHKFYILVLVGLLFTFGIGYIFYKFGFKNTNNRKDSNAYSRLVNYST